MADASCCLAVWWSMEVCSILQDDCSWCRASRDLRAVVFRITYSLSRYTLFTAYFIPMVLLPHHWFVYIKSQELHELNWLLCRRAFFQGAVDFLNMLPAGPFSVCTEFVENGCEKIDHPVDLYARYVQNSATTIEVRLWSKNPVGHPLHLSCQVPMLHSMCVSVAVHTYTAVHTAI